MRTSYHRGNKKLPRIFFDNYDEYLTYIQHDVRKSDKKKTAHSRDLPVGEWVPSTFDQALKNARYGDVETSDAGKALACKIGLDVNHIHKAQTNYRITDEPSDLWDVGEYISGSPDFYLEPENSVVQKKPVKIIVDIGLNSDGTKEDFLRQGVAVSALVHTLEMSDCAVELIVAYHIESTTRTKGLGKYLQDATFYIPIKRAQDAPDNDRLFFLLSTAESYRRLGFSAYERLVAELVGDDIDAYQEFTWTYGRTCSTEIEDDIFPNKKEIIHCKKDEYPRDNDEVKRWVEFKLKNHGIIKHNNGGF